MLDVKFERYLPSKMVRETPPLSEQRNCFASTRETLELLKAFSRLKVCFFAARSSVRHGRPLLQGAQASRLRIRPNLPLFRAPAPLAPIFSFQPTHSRRIGIFDLSRCAKRSPRFTRIMPGTGSHSQTRRSLELAHPPPHSPQSPPAAVPPDRDPCPHPCRRGPCYLTRLLLTRPARPPFYNARNVRASGAVHKRSPRLTLRRPICTFTTHRKAKLERSGGDV